jgi:hypothetical protein
MVITLSGLRSYAKGLDQRFAAYSNDTLNASIKNGLDNLAVQALCFHVEEQTSIKQFTDLGYNEFQLHPSNNIIDYHSKYVVLTSDRTVTPAHSDWLVVSENIDKTLTVYVMQPQEPDYSLLVRYYYYPVLTESNTLDITDETYHYLRHSIQMIFWGGVKDYEKEQYHQKVLDQHLSQRVFRYPNTLTYPSMKGGFV